MGRVMSMAEECFCGCGRKVGFGSGGVNKQGKRAVGLVAKLHKARSKVKADEELANPALLAAIVAKVKDADESDPDSILSGIDDLLVDLIVNGEEFKEFWHRVVHGPMPPNAQQERQRFEAWGRTGMQTIDAVGVPTDRSWGAVRRGDV